MMVDCEAHGESPQPGRKKFCIFVSVTVAVVIFIIIIARAPSTRTETSEVNKVKEIFIDRCKKFKGYNHGNDGCLNAKETFIERWKKFEGFEEVWGAFEKAYVGRDECDVPMEAYDPVFPLAPFRHNYSRTLLWSNCEKFVADFNDKKRCFVIMKDTLLGAAVKDWNWYGKEGSNETFIASHQEWKDCENYTVRSFWRGYSAEFAEAAEGQVTAMLNGSSDPPVKPTSIFASIEVPRLNPTKVHSLYVVLVTPETAVVDCTHPSFTRLRQKLKPGIQFNCKEVPESQIEECKNNKEKPCEACW